MSGAQEKLWLPAMQLIMVIITAILILIIVLTVPGRSRAVATIASIFLKHALKSTHDDYEADTSACSLCMGSHFREKLSQGRYIARANLPRGQLGDKSFSFVDIPPKSAIGHL